jgi:glycosyltransferase involved in cell wall biosynthesis
MTPKADAGALITPVVLTFNEAPNIARTLESLRWAARVVIVDSGSNDETEALARNFPNVSWHVRRFDTHGAQWGFAIRQTGIGSPYVLALDADYQVPGDFVEECRTRFLEGNYAGGIAGFEYRVLGSALQGSVYPPKAVIFRPSALRIEQPGHSQEMRVDGPVYRFASRLIHDDRKPIDRFVLSQLAYSRLEAGRLAAGSARWQDRIRVSGLMPLVAGLAAYFRAGGPFRGRAALHYAYERATFECLLAMRVLADGAAHGPNRVQDLLPIALQEGDDDNGSQRRSEERFGG